ncbi:hypothetical protein QGN32_07330 [Mycolicibacterium sp. ND9-15]|uniref:hypothetical protein n=1 Tax=Mycolicibacterium sp. ND9-15 TaxID=3042320 RepID=UPI002DD80C98|nr:hypothetical protein [Mycolicibacterium sp. ND9-15]WSE57675.1 hypothetical protein QGN32_07330 [Mycolicibacterium sp. ND9-15]
MADAVGQATGGVVGASMDGMIGQVLAVRHPTRVLSSGLVKTSADTSFRRRLRCG